MWFAAASDDGGDPPPAGGTRKVPRGLQKYSSTVGGGSSFGEGDECGDDARSPPPTHFLSRRSPVHCTRACVATSQPLATSVGLHVLRGLGGNAADASVAVAGERGFRKIKMNCPFVVLISR